MPLASASFLSWRVCCKQHDPQHALLLPNSTAAYHTETILCQSFSVAAPAAAPEPPRPASTLFLCLQGDVGSTLIRRSIQGMLEELEYNLWEAILVRLVDYGHTISPELEMAALRWGDSSGGKGCRSSPGLFSANKDGGMQGGGAVHRCKEQGWGQLACRWACGDC